jgi:undecaprenyl-diphosphatase
MSLLSILVLGIIQGLAELLPISSSAHVVVAEKL